MLTQFILKKEKEFEEKYPYVTYLFAREENLEEPMSAFLKSSLEEAYELGFDKGYEIGSTEAGG